MRPECQIERPLTTLKRRSDPDPLRTLETTALRSRPAKLSSTTHPIRGHWRPDATNIPLSIGVMRLALSGLLGVANIGLPLSPADDEAICRTLGIRHGVHLSGGSRFPTRRTALGGSHHGCGLARHARCRPYE